MAVSNGFKPVKMTNISVRISLMFVRTFLYKIEKGNMPIMESLFLVHFFFTLHITCTSTSRQIIGWWLFVIIITIIGNCIKNDDIFLPLLFWLKKYITSLIFHAVKTKLVL